MNRLVTFKLGWNLSRVVLASSPMPVIRQVFNTCGIASVLMALKPDKNKEIDTFLRDLEKKVTKALKIDSFRYDFLDRVQFSAAWLILRAVFKETALLNTVASVIADAEVLRPMLESRLDEMLVYQKSSNNAKIERDHSRLLGNGDISLNLLLSYVQEQKTDVELKLLAALLGLFFKVVLERDGGTPLGTVAHVDPRQPETYVQRVAVLAKQLATGAVFANYEYHWLPLREIGMRIEQFSKEEKDSDVVSEIVNTPHYFKLNNPLSGTVVSVTRADILEKYNFYLFDFDLAAQRRSIEVLKATLKV